MPYPDDQACKPEIPEEETSLSVPTVPSDTVFTTCTILYDSSLSTDFEIRGLLTVATT